ncbi:MAG: NHLP bacteriocin export ABC transporter permease/ATPase subunit [Clostridia bacterium]|nr:NHLP bacteriocin export ABC transporter permease/ATPase subunit [Clostridia bacterium]
MDLVNELAGKEIKAEGNNPVLLAGSDRVWFVREGQVDLFLTRLDGLKPCGARRYLFCAGAGEILCGIQPLEGRDAYGLLAVGRTGTVLWEVTRQELAKKIAEGEFAGAVKDLLTLMRSWLAKLARAAGSTEETELQEIAEVQESQSEYLLKIVQDFLQAKEQEKTINKMKDRQDNQYMNDGLFSLLNAVRPQALLESQLRQGALDNLLFQACQAVGGAKGIQIVQPSILKEKPYGPFPDLLGDIARASQIRTREVILKDKWWSKDNGALVGYREADGSPVAILPLSPHKYELYDPSDGTKTVISEKTAETLKAQAVTFYRPLPNKALNLKDIFSFLYRGIWKRDLIMLAVMGVLGGLAGMVTPIVTGIIFDSVIPDGERQLLLQIGFLLAALAITTFAFNLTRSFAMQRLEGRMEADLQAAVWDRLLSLPAAFFKQFSAGELAERAMGIGQIRGILAGMAVNTIISCFFSIFYFALLFYYNVKLALISTAVVIAVLTISLTAGFLQLRFERELLDLNNKLSGLMFGFLSGISKLKMAGAEKRAFYQWSRVFSQGRNLTWRKEHLGNKAEVFNATVNVLASMILFFALLKLADVKMGAGKFIAFNSAFGSFLGAVLQISEVALQANVIGPLYEKTKPILETRPEYDEDKADPGTLLGNIEVSHINFRYDENGPLILNDVSVRIKAGEYVALVGPSGSGKSTLFRLLLGFEKPETGQVYYDGWDLAKVDVRLLRRQLGVVLQGGQLMPGSIYDNIAGSHPGMTIANAWEAAERAGMAQDIKEMPMGMHTVVTEDGGTLSGGQRQRLMIARALISNPRILYFDEATSALDNKTQEIVSESLSRLKATRIVIAHRLSTIVKCDRIIVLDKGQVVEEGNYEELFAKGGFFTNMAQRQLA